MVARTGPGLGPGSASKNKKRKKTKHGIGPEGVALRRQRVKAISTAPNPFETISTRKKFDVIGKKQKGAGRKVGQARAAAIDKVGWGQGSSSGIFPWGSGFTTSYQNFERMRVELDGTRR